MTTDVDRMTDAELSAWQYDHRDELDAFEGDPADIKVSPHLSVTMSFRLPSDEADAVRRAAAAAGLTLSELIRRACAASIDGAAHSASREGDEGVKAVEQQLGEIEATGHELIRRAEHLRRELST